MPAEEVCDGFLQLGNVKGESSDSEFKGAIEIRSFDFGSSTAFEDEDAYYAVQQIGAQQSIAFNRMLSTGMFDVDDLGMPTDVDPEELQKYTGKDLTEEDACQFEIVKEVDISSPDLFVAYCSTQVPEKRIVFPKAVVSLRKMGGADKPQVFLQFTFSDVIVAGYVFNTQGDKPPTETVTLAFGRVRMEYRPQEVSGALGKRISYGWSFLDRDVW